MPNRRITQFPPVTAGQIVDQDLLTTVSVFEIDPALRNKKITFTEFREYLDTYYVNTNEIDPIIVPNAIVSGNLLVSGSTFFTGPVNFSGNVNIGQSLDVSGNISTSGNANIGGNIDAQFIDCVFVTTDGLEVQGNAFVQSTLSGTTANFVSGNFERTF